MAIGGTGWARGGCGGQGRLGAGRAAQVVGRPGQVVGRLRSGCGQGSGRRPCLVDSPMSAERTLSGPDEVQTVPVMMASPESGTKVMCRLHTGHKNTTVLVSPRTSTGVYLLYVLGSVPGISAPSKINQLALGLGERHREL